APAPPAPAPTPTPSGTAILPGESIQAKVDAAPAGTQFVLKPGVHRLQSVTPKDGNAFVGEPGAVLAGARLLTAFTREGAYWVAGGQTQESAPHGSCWAAYPRCNRAHDLFRDDVPLRHVASLAELGPGRWYFDYAADKIYLADDPAGHTVEASVTAQAFAGPASNVTVRGLVVEKYANPAQAGAIDAGRGAGWVVRDTEVRLTHGTGIRIGTRAQVVGNNVHDNGQLGVGGVGDNALVENNTIAYNNRAGYDAGWEGGGTKFASTHDLVVRGNFVHHNQGPGLWTDIDNMRTLYEGNRVEDNRESGIFHEISYDAVIRNNVVRRNGFGFSGWLYGAGILVSSSSNVEVVGNTVEDNAHGITGIDQQRGTGRYGPWILLNLLVHQNTVRVGATGKAAGVAGDLALFTAARNIRYRANRYQLGANPWPFEWDSRGLLEAGWRAAGQDADGTFTR
ncbi:MAG TPA: right-handed parallel beta-helix repeat-containing protein, partial [Gemmatirosa sp.]|nr:right-handed parallel beta-helix repeat-containing protein [Gemmatirosa sp.]